MDGIQLATLRGICATYFQAHVEPALAELREAQLALRQQLQQHTELASASATKLQLGRDSDEEEHSNGTPDRLGSLEPSSKEVEDEEEEKKERNGHDIGRSLCNGEDFWRSEEQAGRLCSTWKEEFRRLEAQLNDLNDRVSSHAHQQSTSTLPCPLDEVKANQDELQQALAGKADQVTVASLAQQQQDICARLEQKINRKADLGAVATLAQVQEVSTATDRKLKKMSESLDKKANANKVPQLSQVQELKEAVQRKIDASLVPTLAQVEELERLVERLERERLERLEVQSIGKKVEELATKLEQKANGNDITSAIGEVHEWITTAVDGKLSADDLLSLDTIERMADRLEEHWCQKGCSRGSRPAMQPAQFFQQPVAMQNNGWSAPKRPNKASTWDGMALHQEDGAGTGLMEVAAVWCPIDGGPCQPLQMWMAPSPFGGGDASGCGAAVDNRHHHRQHHQNNHHHRSHPPHHHHHHNNHHYNEQHHQQHPTPGQQLDASQIEGSQAAWAPVFQVGYNGTHHHPRHWRSRPPRWQQQQQQQHQQQQHQLHNQQLHEQQQEEHLQQPSLQQEQHEEELNEQHQPEQLEEDERQERHEEEHCQEESDAGSGQPLHANHGHGSCASLGSQDHVSCRSDHDVIHDQER